MFWISVILFFAALGAKQIISKGTISIWCIVGVIYPILAILHIGTWTRVIICMTVYLIYILVLTHLALQLIGKTGEVTKRISYRGMTGEVYINGMTWKARVDESCSYDHIDVGELVEVVNNRVVMLTVKIKNKGEN